MSLISNEQYANHWLANRALEEVISPTPDQIAKFNGTEPEYKHYQALSAMYAYVKAVDPKFKDSDLLQDLPPPIKVVRDRFLSMCFYHRVSEPVGYHFSIGASTKREDGTVRKARYDIGLYFKPTIFPNLWFVVSEVYRSEEDDTIAGATEALIEFVSDVNSDITNGHIDTMHKYYNQIVNDGNVDDRSFNQNVVFGMMLDKFSKPIAVN